MICWLIKTKVGYKLKPLAQWNNFCPGKEKATYSWNFQGTKCLVVSYTVALALSNFSLKILQINHYRFFICKQQM